MPRKKTGDELLQRICASPDDDTAHDLLMAFSRGYPAHNLLTLFRSENEAVVKMGAWIASELGHLFVAILDEISVLLDHPSRFVRFDIINCVLLAADERHGRITAKALALICDPDSAVRWKAMGFVARATQSQLTAAFPYINDGALVERLTWISNMSFYGADRKAIIQGLDSPDELTRRFAAAAAARFSDKDQGPLQYAALSSDSEIKTFADSELGVLTSH